MREPIRQGKVVSLRNEPLGRLRSDLVIIPHSTGTQTTYRVVAPGSTLEFQFHEVELAVAQSLDGKRGIDEVIEAVHGKGFAVTPDQVRSFYREIKGMSFVSEDGSVAEPPPLAGNDHSADAKGFLRQGLAYLAAGKFEFARSNLEACLELDAGNEVAKQAMSECAQAEQQQAAAAVSAPGSPPPLPLRRQRLQMILWASVGAAAVLIGLVLYHVFVIRPETAVERQVVVAKPQPEAPRPTAKAPPAPKGEEITATVEAVERPTIAQITSPMAARMLRFLVENGAVVEQGTKVAVIGLQGKGGKAPRANLRQLEQLAEQDADYEVFLEREREKVPQKGSAPKRFALLAPAKGVFVLRVTAGSPLQSGQVIAEIQSADERRLSAHVGSTKVDATWICTVENTSQQAPCLIDKLARQGNRTVVTAMARGAWLAPGQSLTLRLRPVTR